MKRKFCFAFLFIVLFSGLTSVSAGVGIITGQIESEIPFLLTNGFATMVNILVRIMVTIAIEVTILLLFAMRTIKAICVVAAANAITTLMVGGVLVCIFETSGIWAFYFMAILLEATVIVIELVIYSVRLKGVPFWKLLTYTVVANAITFILGLRFITII